MLKGGAASRDVASAYASLSFALPQWWIKVTPAAKSDLTLQHMLASAGGDGAHSPFVAEWTEFDQRKLQHALQMLLHGATFLRVLTAQHVQLHRQGGAVRSPPASIFSFVDVEALTVAFCQVSACVDLVQTQHSPHSAATLSALWLTSAQTSVATGAGYHERKWRGVVELLIVVAENLICLIQDLTLLVAQEGTMNRIGSSAGGDFLRKWYGAVQKVLRAAEDVYPTHSFVRQVARWVSDNFDSIQMK